MFESFKPYKKENFDKAEIEAKLATADANVSDRKEFIPYSGPTAGSYQRDQQGYYAGHWVDTEAGKREKRALKKLENLKNKAHSEGLALEARHDKLMENLRKAQEELDQFRQTELGMSEDIEDEADKTVAESAE